MVRTCMAQEEELQDEPMPGETPVLCDKCGVRVTGVKAGVRVRVRGVAYCAGCYRGVAPRKTGLGYMDGWWFELGKEE